MQHREPIIGPRFTLEQIAALVISTESNDWGFHVETDRDNPQMPEIAELWLHNPTMPLFFITPLTNGDVELYDVVHELHKIDPIQEALASINMIEAVAAESPF